MTQEEAEEYTLARAVLNNQLAALLVGWKETP